MRIYEVHGLEGRTVHHVRIMYLEELSKPKRICQNS
jgi:hypothetical protein